MPIHGKLLMTLPFRGISETDSEFQFLHAFFPSENLSSAKRSPRFPALLSPFQHQICWEEYGKNLLLQIGLHAFKLHDIMVDT